MNFSIQAIRNKVSFVFLFAIAFCHHFNHLWALSLEDEIQYNLVWPGGSVTEDLLKSDADNVINLKTQNNEQYYCKLPDTGSIENSKKIDTSVYISAKSIMEQIYAKKTCSYRIESYWIYELCHGQHVRQYHETKQGGKKVVPEEYFLGYYNEKIQPQDFYLDDSGIKKTNIQWKVIDGKRIPFFTVKYTDGTLCAILDNKPREITILYACEENSNEMIVSFEETSSCMYEMIVQSKHLCAHPDFKIEKLPKQQIECYSVSGSSQKPQELIDLEFESENSKLLNNRMSMTNQDGSVFVVQYKTVDDDASSNFEESNKNLPENSHENQPQQPGPPADVGQRADKDILESFISGANCLTGGSGWWKYDICYGKHVIQFHEADINTQRIDIYLGKWNIEKHMEWVKKKQEKNANKKTDKSYVSLFYTDGNFCELSNKPRDVEVRLKCDKTRPKSHAITLYLLEPVVCEYILTVESALLCNLVENSDEYGLYKEPVDEEDITDIDP